MHWEQISCPNYRMVANPNPPTSLLVDRNYTALPTLANQELKCGQMGTAKEWKQ